MIPRFGVKFYVKMTKFSFTMVLVDFQHEPIEILWNFTQQYAKAIAMKNKSLVFPQPFYEFLYYLEGQILNYVENEKDLGFYTNHKISWTAHCEWLSRKLLSSLTFWEELATLWMIVNSGDWRALYLTWVRSIFEGYRTRGRPTRARRTRCRWRKK